MMNTKMQNILILFIVLSLTVDISEGKYLLISEGFKDGGTLGKDQLLLPGLG